MEERQQALVARGLDDDPHRAEPVAERRDALDERADAVEPRQRHLHRERESVAASASRPALELILGGQAVAGRVELDGVEALGVEAEERLRVGTGGIEAAAPGRVAPARRPTWITAPD